MLYPFRKVFLCGLIVLTAVSLSACSDTPSRLVELDTNTVNRISIERFDDEIVLEKDNGRWFLTEPVQVLANPVTVENLLITVEQLTVEERVSRDPDEYGSYGVDSNAPVITISGPDGSQRIIVGRGGGDINLQYIRVDETEDVYLASGRLNTTMRPDVWRDRTIVDIDPALVEEIRVVEPNDSYVLTKTSEGWEMSGVTGSPIVASGSVEQWLNHYAPLRTDGFAPITPDIVLESAGHRIEFELVDGSTQVIYFLDVGAEYAVVADGNSSVFHVFAMRVNTFFANPSSFIAGTG